MRILAVATLALLAACSGAKPADTTATYVREAPNGPITVRTAANGDARVDAGGTEYLRKGDREFVVLKDGAGTFSVPRNMLLDWYAEADKGLAGIAQPRGEPDYLMREGGSETIAGYRGTIWIVHPKDVPSLPAAEAVISGDPALGPTGRALAMQSSFAIRRNSAMIGGPGKLPRAFIALFDKGAVLRFGSMIKLDKIDHAPIPANVFDLPRPLLDAAGLRKRMEAERARLAQPAD